MRVVMKAEHGSDGDTQVNVLHYDIHDTSFPFHDIDPQDLADRFRDDVMTPFAALYDDSWSIAPVEVQEELDPQHPTAPRSSWLSGSATPGTRGTSSEGPRGACIVATLHTGSIGRRYTGRVFVGGSWRVTDYVNDTWQSSALALADDYLSAIPLSPDLVEGESTASADWSVYSRTQRASDLDPYASHIASYQLRPAFRYLRTRQP